MIFPSNLIAILTKALSCHSALMFRFVNFKFTLIYCLVLLWPCWFAFYSIRFLCLFARAQSVISLNDFLFLHFLKSAFKFGSLIDYFHSFNSSIITHSFNFYLPDSAFPILIFHYHSTTCNFLPLSRPITTTISSFAIHFVLLDLPELIACLFIVYYPLIPLPFASIINSTCLLLQEAY